MPLFYRDLHLRALEAAYHRHYDQLCAVAAAVLGGDAALAQDAVQEAWLRLNAPGVRERIRTEDADRLRGLLLVTVRNAARNLRRAAPAAREPTRRKISCAHKRQTPFPRRGKGVLVCGCPAGGGDQSSETGMLWLKRSSARAAAMPTRMQTTLTTAATGVTAKVPKGMIMMVAAMTMPMMAWKASG